MVAVVVDGAGCGWIPAPHQELGLIENPWITGDYCIMREMDVCRGNGYGVGLDVVAAGGLRNGPGMFCNVVVKRSGNPI